MFAVLYIGKNPLYIKTYTLQNACVAFLSNDLVVSFKYEFPSSLERTTVCLQRGCICTA